MVTNHIVVCIGAYQGLATIDDMAEEEEHVEKDVESSEEPDEGSGGDSSDEPEVEQLAKNMPKRSTRGSRYGFGHLREGFSVACAG